MKYRPRKSFDYCPDFLPTEIDDTLVAVVVVAATVVGLMWARLIYLILFY